MRSVIVVLLACAAAVLLAGRPGHTQPAPDLDRARTLYAAAEQALAEDRVADALRDYQAAYDITRDPALLYKLGVAHAKAGACRDAVAHLAAYLRIGKPTPDFFALTRERIRTCGYDPDALPADLEDPTRAATGSTGSGAGSAGASAGSAGSAGSTGSASPTLAGSGSGSDVAIGAGSGRTVPRVGQHRTAWILVGGAIAAATLGAVLGYSAKASESDLDDLYVGLGGVPPRFDDSTRAQFDDLVAEGKRYRTLSWVSFGVAGVLGGLAAWRFTIHERAVHVTPAATPGGASVTAGWRF